MATEYRLAFATITKAVLEANSAYQIENFTLQSDQNYNTPWTPPSDNGTQYPRLARYVTTAGLTQRGDGFYTFQWTLPYLTEGMVNALEGNGAIYMAAFGGLLWSGCTVKTLCRDGVFRCYQANVLLPYEEGQHFKRGYQGVEDYVLRFVRGVNIV